MLPYSGFEPKIFVTSLSGQNVAHAQDYLHVHYLDQELNLAPFILWASVIHNFMLNEDLTLQELIFLILYLFWTLILF